MARRNHARRRSTLALLAPVALGVGLGALLLAGRLLEGDGVVAATRALAAAAIAVAVVARVREVRAIAKGGAAAAVGYVIVACAAAVHLVVDGMLGGDVGAIGSLDGADSAALLRVAWTAAMTVGVCVVLFVERAWTSMTPALRAVAGAGAPQRRRLRAALASGASTGLLLVGTFALNYAVHGRDARWDLSYFKTTQPGSATLALVGELDAPIEALLFFPPVDEVLAELRPYFDALAAASPNFRYRVLDHALEPELAAAAKVRGNGWVLVRKRPPEGSGDAATGDGAAAGTAAGTGESIEIGADREQARAKLRRLDGLVHRAIAHLGRPARKLTLTVGHDERSREGTAGDADAARLRKLHALLDRFGVATDTIGMADGLAQRVPEGTAAIAVLGPRKPLLPEEADTLLRYVEGGGRLLVLLDPDADDGLDPLLRGLGLRRRAGVVASETHHMRRSHTPGDVAVVFANAYSTHPTVTTVGRNAGRVATVLVRGAALAPTTGEGKLAGATTTFTLRSADDFWLDVDGDLRRGEGEPRERLELMAAVAVPPKATPATGASSAASAPQEGRAVVIGDGDLVSDALIANPGNGALFVDVLRWLIGEDGEVGELESEEDIPIEHRKASDTLWFYATTFGAPLPLLLMGLWIGRRNRRGLRASDAGRA